jgi:inner membrane protein
MFVSGVQGISRSMGMKLILVCGLALSMAIPALFVQGLVEERTMLHAASVQQTGGAAVGRETIFGIKAADPYRSVNRSMKYLPLFLGLLFLSYFVFEVTTGKRVHPAQYVLVGIAQIIFYLLLLSLAERIGFDFSFLIAGSATVLLLSANAGWVFSSRMQGMRAFAIFSLLYALIYMLLRLEDNALLVGAVASFLAIAATMYFTRRIDWYSSLQMGGAPLQAAPMAAKDTL